MPLSTEVGIGPGHIVLDGDPALPHGKGHSSPHFSTHVYCGETVAHLSNLLSYCGNKNVPVRCTGRTFTKSTDQNVSVRVGLEREETQAPRPTRSATERFTASHTQVSRGTHIWRVPVLTLHLQR